MGKGWHCLIVQKNDSLLLTHVTLTYIFVYHGSYQGFPRVEAEGGGGTKYMVEDKWGGGGGLSIMGGGFQ